MRSLLILVVVTSLAHAAPPEPHGPHPRMLLDGQLKAAWAEQAKLAHGPVVGAIKVCQAARDGHDYDRAVYQGSQWAKALQACLVAYAATGNKDDAQTAIHFMTALLDDLDQINDKAGGDAAASRDDGYALRNLAPYTALAYDWLYDQLTPDQRAHARARWKAWLARYLEKGYRPHDPGSNYQAGYITSATLIAVAEGGEGGGDSADLWKTVADTIWGKEMAPALSDEGILRGGDWPEGWQYGPLSVAEYALAMRVARGAGIEVNGVSAWLHALLQRHVYGLSPADGVYPLADTEDEAPNLKPSVLVLDAIALGDSSPDDKRWAKGKLSRLKLADEDALLYDALAGVGDKPVLIPRDSWPTAYLADGTGTLYARTRWDDRAIWFVTSCKGGMDRDHRHPDAGNFVLARGKDDVIVDPSPYGSQSTFTSNAPTVRSAQLPKEYQPSQAGWGDPSFDFVTQRKSGTIATRCDYSDAFKFQERKSDVPDALRDVVVIPSADGSEAAVVVLDRATTGGDDRDLYLRFRTPGHLALSGTAATATIGGTQLAITALQPEKPAIGAPSLKDCFKEGTVRGTCDAARFPITEYKVELPGSHPIAAHVIAATGGTAVTTQPISGDGIGGVAIKGVRDAAVIWRTSGDGDLAYTAPPGLHVVLDAGDRDGHATATATPSGGACAVKVAGGGTMSARPLVITVDPQCKVTEDPEGGALSAAHTRAPGTHHGGHAGRSPRSGCCGAQAAPASPIAMSLVVVSALLRRRRRSRTHS
ncbi:MAG: hypothetical protein JO257_13065 [Deltaproteobacteria bacterium]|nr:hypothetical protein [Deltaproteobacteria bacterium]